MTAFASLHSDAALLQASSLLPPPQALFHLRTESRSFKPAARLWRLWLQNTKAAWLQSLRQRQDIK
jgi:hypothetical protein